LRSFVALPLPDPVLDSLESLQAGLPAGRPSRRDTLHLTLAFVGEHSPEAVEALHEELERISAPAFDVQLTGVGTFGKSSPAVLWAGVEKNEALEALHGQVLSAMRRAQLPVPPGRFRPHVTIARFGRGQHPDCLRRLAGFIAARAAFRAPLFRATGFTLYRSTLHPEGALHEALASYPLHPEGGGAEAAR